VLDDCPIDWRCDDPEIGRFQYRHDQPAVWLEDSYYVTWYNDYHSQISDKYMMVNRSSDNGYTLIGDICLGHSQDMIHWGKHRFVMDVKEGWQITKLFQPSFIISYDRSSEKYIF
jgi:beta-1,4-mannooligosaccharide/beta-1,4-mannosyl-N-acetylglucosamine phosphorylase